MLDSALKCAFSIKRLRTHSKNNIFKISVFRGFTVCVFVYVSERGFLYVSCILIFMVGFIWYSVAHVHAVYVCIYVVHANIYGNIKYIFINVYVLHVGVSKLKNNLLYNSESSSAFDMNHWKGLYLCLKLVCIIPQ